MRSLIVMTFLVLLSCNSETQNQDEPDQTGVDMVNDKSSDSNDTFSFPQLHSIANCAEPPRAPELCEWGLAAHDIVLLEVTETSQIVSPILDTKTGMVVENCEGIIQAGFRMEGIVRQSINGLSGKITVDVGLMQFIDSWDPLPLTDPTTDGLTEWSGRAAIKAGDVIGLTLHKELTDGTLGILGEHFFDINAKNTIRFGELHSECGTPQPKNVSGLTFDKLKEEIKQCEPSTMVDARKQAKERLWQGPQYANLGTCYSQ